MRINSKIERIKSLFICPDESAWDRFRNSENCVSYYYWPYPPDEKESSEKLYEADNDIIFCCLSTYKDTRQNCTAAWPDDVQDENKEGHAII